MYSLSVVSKSVHRRDNPRFDHLNPGDRFRFAGEDNVYVKGRGDWYHDAVYVDCWYKANAAADVFHA